MKHDLLPKVAHFFRFAEKIFHALMSGAHAGERAGQVRSLRSLRDRSPIAFGTLGVLPVDAIEQHSQVRGTHADPALACGCRRELKGACLQAFVDDHEAVLVPVEQLDAITPLVAEDEYVPRERILLEMLANQFRQRVETFAQVGWVGRQPNAHGCRKAQHDGCSSSTASNCRKVAASKPGATRSVRLPGST